MHALLSVWAITSASLLGPISSCHDDEVEIPVSEVPAAFRKAADEAVPRAQWDKGGREVVEGGETYYSLSGKDARGRDVEVQSDSDCGLSFVTTDIVEGDVPDIVMRALKKAAPQFHPTRFVEVTRGSKLEGYGFEGEPKDKVAGAFVDSDGKKVQLCDEDSNPL